MDNRNPHPEYQEAPQGWTEYKQLVVSELRRLDQGIQSLSAKFDALKEDPIGIMRTELAVLKFQCLMITTSISFALSVAVSIAAAWIAHHQ